MGVKWTDTEKRRKKGIKHVGALRERNDEEESAEIRGASGEFQRWSAVQWERDFS